MKTSDLIKALQSGEEVDQEAIIKALETTQKASSSDRVAKYGKGHDTKTWLLPDTLHKSLQSQIESQGYKSQKDASYHAAEIIEALFESFDRVADLDPVDIVEAVEQFKSSEV